MALFQSNCFSEILGVSVSFNVIIPQNTEGQIGLSTPDDRDAFPVLYLLHGLSDDHSFWCRMTSIERYASEAGLAVVMPAVNRSFYTDMTHGYNYHTFIADELPELVKQFFPVSHQRQDTFIAGLSMGGYGCMKMALTYPERYAAAASLSGALDPAGDPDLLTELKDDMELCYGGAERLAGTDNDLFTLADQLVSSGNERPALYAWCGTEDALYPENLSFRDHCERIGLELTYEENVGDHGWKHWDDKIQRVIEWLPGLSR
ncbi:MAG: Putative esterase [Olavius algarvensis Gamma 1 endosymbiont]|nr:MAG: Putative esterase [Olavius algarvensis Gamma 1 endosymbiont]